MLAHLLILAQAAHPPMEVGPEPLKPGTLFGDKGVAILLVSLLALGVILFFWAFFVRKRPRQTRGALVVDRNRGASTEAVGASGRRRRKRRDAHPENWGRNPTLSETGGLPPPRPDDLEPPASNSSRTP